jgi:tetratricopeptide (TPR) repeat protein
MNTMRRRILIVLALSVGLALATWFAAREVSARQLQSELRAAQRDFVARHLSDAKKRLATLAKRWPGRGDVEYWLGACEMAAGQNDAALATWGRVPDAANEAQLAALSRGRLALETGHYRIAETSLERAIRSGNDMSQEARRLLSTLHWMTGRRDLYRAFLHREVERLRHASESLRTLWSLDFDPYPIDGFTIALDRARQAAPDDDRVWLALADLAIRAGRFDEADRWLTQCERARPDDGAIWRARLAWAQAAAKPDEVMRSAAHLPASSLPHPRVLELRAWLAAERGDRQAERAALESMLALEPADAVAVERLADLAAQDGEKERVAELRRRKTDIENARESYRQLINRPDLAPLAPELARWAETIGRRFDAKAWWRIAVERDQSLESEAASALARLAKAVPPPITSGESLAGLLGPRNLPARSKALLPGDLSIPTFADEAASRYLNFTFNNGLTDLHQMPETMSGGVGVLDFDGDGWLDVYAIQGGKFPPPAGSLRFNDRLFRNRGDGRFEDVTASSGLAALPGGYGHGIAVGDYDNDGRPDIFITRWRSYSLYHNLRGGHFDDVTARAGLGGDRDWPTSAAWADLDNDGDLDLYVCHYVKWDTVNPPLCDYPGNPERGHTYCDPRGFPAMPDRLFRNDGGRFVDVTDQAGIVDRDGRGLGVVAADFDDDGKIDLFVANDTTANYFFRNQGGLRFAEEGLESGLATSAGGGFLAGMGVACGDFDGDGRIDLAVTNFINQSTTLYHNHGGGVFSDRSAEAGLAASTRMVLGFGLAALDANNDGWLDLVQANGHVGDYRPAIPYAMRAQLFLGDGRARLIDVSDRAGPAWQPLRLGRGLAIGDFDNDGQTDVLIVGENSSLAFLHNQSAASNHWLILALEGTASNRDAVGARVAVTTAGRTLVAARFGGGSYLSASDRRLHFGLGSVRSVDRVEVAWPSGRRDTYQTLAADGGYSLREGDSAPKPLAGFRHEATKR